TPGGSFSMEEGLTTVCVSRMTDAYWRTWLQESDGYPSLYSLAVWPNLTRLKSSDDSVRESGHWLLGVRMLGACYCSELSQTFPMWRHLLFSLRLGTTRFVALPVSGPSWHTLASIQA